MDSSNDNHAGAAAVTLVRCNTDNFAYLLSDAGSGNCLVIDPGHAKAVWNAVRSKGLRIERFLATHGHADHTAGAASLLRWTGCPPIEPPGGDGYGSSGIHWRGGRLKVFSVPGHTRDHVVYYDGGAGMLFTGDTLFVAGCGRLFECDAATMWNSLERLMEFPAETRIYPGHDYTLENLSFAAHLVPGDQAVADRLTAARAGQAMVPSTLAQERRTNPFLRCADPEFRRRLGFSGLSPAACFQALRRRKDRW